MSLGPSGRPVQDFIDVEDLRPADREGDGAREGIGRYRDLVDLARALGDDGIGDRVRQFGRHRARRDDRRERLLRARAPAIDDIEAPSKLLRDDPDIKVELNTESAPIEIVAQRFGAGVRLGEQVEKDMVALRTGPEARMIVVAGGITPGSSQRTATR